MTLAVLADFARRGWWIDDEREISAAEALRARLDVRSHSLDQPARSSAEEINRRW